jgi:hypothetical protein
MLSLHNHANLTVKNLQILEFALLPKSADGEHQDDDEGPLAMVHG